jgi:hypothetical protein
MPSPAVLTTTPFVTPVTAAKLGIKEPNVLKIAKRVGNIQSLMAFSSYVISWASEREGKYGEADFGAMLNEYAEQVGGSFLLALLML